MQRLVGMKEEIVALLEQTMDPTTSALVRLALPGEVVTLGTALARTVMQTTIKFYQEPYDAPHIQTMSGVTAPLFSAESSYYVTLLRDPVVRAIARVDNTRAVVTGRQSYELSFGLPHSPEPAQFILDRDAAFDVPVAAAIHTGGWECYGKWTPAGNANGCRVIWLDGLPRSATGSVVTAKLNAGVFVVNDPSDADDRISFEVWRHTPEGRVLYYTQILERVPEVDENMFRTQTAAGAASPVYIEVSGYYSFTFNLISADNSTYSPQMTGLSISYDSNLNTAVRHYCTADIENKSHQLIDSRIIGASVLLSNVDQVIERGGSAIMAQVAGSTSWYEYWHSSEKLDTVNAQARSVVNWENGAYAYVKPQGSAPFELRSAFKHNTSPTVNTGHQPLPQFEPFADSAHVVIRVDPPPKTGDDAGSTLRLTLTTAMEFTTNDQFYQVETSVIPSAIHNEYVEALRAMPQFFDNPIHVAAIAKLAQAAALSFMTWSPRIRRGLEWTEKFVGNFV